MVTNSKNTLQLDKEVEELWQEGLGLKEWQRLKKGLLEEANPLPDAGLRMRLKEIGSQTSNRGGLFGYPIQFAGGFLAATLIFLMVGQFSQRTESVPSQVAGLEYEFEDLSNQFAFVMNGESQAEDIFESDLGEMEKLIWNL